MGRLTAGVAVQRGLSPLLLGRDPAALRRVAGPLGLSVRAVGLADPDRLAGALADVTVLLNAAGPFGVTAPPLVDACLRTGTHYLDFAGEAVDFAALAGRDDELRRAGVMAMPGVGFGVVPTDAVARHLVDRLPSATRVELTFATEGGLSRGTVGTLLDGLPQVGWQYRDGRLVPARAGERRRRVPDGRGGSLLAVTNPWRADLVSAPVTTGVPTVSTFTVLPGPVRALMGVAPRVPWLFTAGWSRRLQAALVRRLPAGPDDAALRAGSSLVHGLASDDDGGRVEAVLTGPEPYLYTAHTGAELLARSADGRVEPGFATPAGVHGVDVARCAPGVHLVDLEAR
jgi:short subunit dehydrogenase-like uncharacterized protein